MKITNHNNLPLPLVSAVEGFERKQRAGDISVTELIGPPLIRILKRDHWDEIEEDAADRMWMLLGSAVHQVLERADTRNHFAEEQLTTEIGGWTLSGRPDLLAPDLDLDDYKVTSVYAFLLEDKAEWEAQLNVYAWLYRRHGFSPKRLRIVAILRDWSRSRAKADPEYPQQPVMVRLIPMWDDAQVQAYVEQRIQIHQEAEAGIVDPCTDRDRWHRPDSWAVVKNGNKRAMRVFDNETAAEAMAVTRPEYRVDHRLGEDVRCAYFCPVREFCRFKRAQSAGGNAA